MAVVRISNTLRPLVDGVTEIEVAAADLGGLLDELQAAHPDLSERIVNEDGRLYGFVNVFVGDVECRTLGGMATPLTPDSVVSVVPAVAGG